MVPKRSQPSGSSKSGSASPRRRRSRPSSNVTSPDVTPPPQPASERAPKAEIDLSSKVPATTAEEATRRPPSAADVAGAIEHERVELLQIQALLTCLYEVLLYADDDDSVMHADVAQVCARLIKESVRRLGDLLMQGSDRNSSHDFDDSGVSESCGSER
jgi:hypothetical protein